MRFSEVMGSPELGNDVLVLKCAASTALPSNRDHSLVETPGSCLCYARTEH